MSQIQDIAGCRLIVSDLTEQDRVTDSLSELFPTTNVVDRRQHPSHGYRAVHVIVKVDTKAVEIQVRTTLQQLWAELSEKLSDLIDPVIKYGGGNASLQEVLSKASRVVAKQEEKELDILKAQQALTNLSFGAEMTQDHSKSIIDMQKICDSYQTVLIATRRELIELFKSLIKNPPRLGQGA